jgi:hypothetical protein
MKCFMAQRSPYFYWQSWTADPKTIPGSPIADQSTGSNEAFPRRRSQIETGE